MSKLYGSVRGDDKTARTTPANRVIETWVQTEYGRIVVSLNANGNYTIATIGVCGYGPDWTSEVVTLATGNVNDKYKPSL